VNITNAIDLIVESFFIQQETKERFAIELVSGPGLGKSAAVYQAADKIAKRLGKALTVKPFFLTTVEPPDVRGFGLPGRDSDGTPIMQFTKAPWMPRIGDSDFGIVFLDEFGQSNQDVAKPAAELFHSGRVGESQLPISYMVIAASNRESDRSGVGRSLAFIDNRKMRVNIEPDLNAWVDWAERQPIHHAAISFAKVRPNLVFQDKVPEKPGPFCTPRTLCKVSHLIGKLPMDLFTEASAGYLGEGASAEFVAHLRVVDELPKWEDIVAAPDKVRMPENRTDATYAAMQMVSHRVDAQTAKPAFIFLKRLGKEFQVAGLKAVLKRCPTMIQTPDFAAWLRENKELVYAANVLEKK
jgi:hypothetical protein